MPHRPPAPTPLPQPRNYEKPKAKKTHHEGEFLDGGGRRDRTDDILRAKQMLSQLSYTPVRMVGLGRLELPTSRLSGARSNQLSYRPGFIPLGAKYI